jgi:hypothetical protein
MPGNIESRSGCFRDWLFSGPNRSRHLILIFEQEGRQVYGSSGWIFWLDLLAGSSGCIFWLDLLGGSSGWIFWLYLLVVSSGYIFWLYLLAISLAARPCSRTGS